MTEEEFIKKAKELGYSDKEIEETIKEHDMAEKKGIKIPYECSLVEPPYYSQM